MAALGAPIVNDPFYPEISEGPDAPDDYNRPLKLLAQGLAFIDPLSGEQRRFESRLSLLCAFFIEVGLIARCYRAVRAAFHSQL
jgi:hypothetical protein